MVENPSKVRDILSRSDSTELYQVLIRIATSLEDGTGAQVLYDEKIQEVLFNKFVGAASVKVHFQSYLFHFLYIFLHEIEIKNERLVLFKDKYLNLYHIHLW